MINLVYWVYSTDSTVVRFSHGIPKLVNAEEFSSVTVCYGFPKLKIFVYLFCAIIQLSLLCMTLVSDQHFHVEMQMKFLIVHSSNRSKSIIWS